MADEVVKRKVQVLTAGGAPLRTHTAIFFKKEGDTVRFITEDGKTFELPADQVQVSDKLEGKKFTKTKKGAAAAAPSDAPRVGRENSLRGMTGNQRTFDAGNAMQRRIYRSLKTTQGWYSLSLAERVQANISALKKAGVSNDLIPGIVDQMSRQYFSGKGAAESKRGQEAIAVLEKFAGSKVTGGVRRVITRGVSARRAMGAGNVYNEEGKVEKRTGKSRRELIKTGSRGGTSRVPTPVGGYSARGKEVNTAREKALSSAKRVSEGLEAIEEMAGEPRRFGKAKFTKAPEGAVEKKLEISENRFLGKDELDNDILKPVKKTVTLLFKNGMYYVPKGNGYAALSKSETKEWFLSGGEKKGKSVSKSSPSEGKAKATTKFLLRESRIGARMNDERLVAIAKEMIAQARKTGNIPKEGGYTALLLRQPQFEGIDSKDLRRIVALAKADTRMQKVQRREKKKGVREKTDRRTKLSPTGRDITDERTPRTQKGKDTRAAVAKAEEQIVREDFGRRDAVRKDKKREQIRGEKPKGAMRPAKPISITAARRMEQEIAEGKKPSPVFKKRGTREIVKEAAAAGKVRISETRLNKRDREALALLEKLPDRTSRVQAADMLKMSTKARSKAMSKNLLSLAGMYGANYILSQLGEETRKRGKR
jgi:hypothetical protein